MEDNIMKIKPSSDKKYRIQDAEVLKKYIHSEYGVLTLTDPTETVSHSYIFRRPKRGSGFPPDVCFAFCIHADTLFYLGIVEQGVFRLTKRSRFAEDTDIVKGAAYIVKMTYKPGLAEKSPMILTHSGHCARCGRPLTSEFGIKYGFGRKCIRHVVTGQEFVSPT